MEGGQGMRRADGRDRQESGLALIIVVLVLALIGAMAVFAINESGAELAGSGRTRGAARAFYAADAGVQIALRRLAQNPPVTTAIDVPLNGWTVQSRTRNQGTAQPITLDTNYGPPPEGYALEAGFQSELYLVNMTATGAGEAELEAKVSRLAAGLGGY
jgi:hypothetical protein